VLKTDNLPTSCAVATKSGSLNFLEPSGLVQAYNGTALPLPFRGQYSIWGSGDPSAVICRLDTGGEKSLLRVTTDLSPQEIPVGSNCVRGTAGPDDLKNRKIPCRW